MLFEVEAVGVSKGLVLGGFAGTVCVGVICELELCRVCKSLACSITAYGLVIYCSSVSDVENRSCTLGLSLYGNWLTLFVRELVDILDVDLKIGTCGVTSMAAPDWATSTSFAVPGRLAMSSMGPSFT